MSGTPFLLSKRNEDSFVQMHEKSEERTKMSLKSTEIWRVLRENTGELVQIYGILHEKMILA